MRDGVREAVWECWTKCEGLRGVWVFRLVKRCVYTFFFFFFLNFGLTWPFRPIRTESARFWPRQRRFPPNRRRFQPRRPDSGLATWHDAVRRGMDARSVTSLPRPRVPPHRTRVRWPGRRVRASQIKTNVMRQGPINIEEINKSISMYFMAIIEWKILTELEKCVINQFSKNFINIMNFIFMIHNINSCITRINVIHKNNKILWVFIVETGEGPKTLEWIKSNWAYEKRFTIIKG